MPFKLEFQRKEGSRTRSVLGPLQLQPDLVLMASAIWLALLIDLLWGEPASTIHPVVWMGAYLSAVGKKTSRLMDERSRPFFEFSAGAMGWCFGAGLVFGVALGIGFLIQTAAPWIQCVLLGLFLKPMLSWRMLRDEVSSVEHSLAISLEAGRTRVGYLVSRCVEELNEFEVRQAAISSLAENLNDSVVAPLFWFVLAGLPGAALYRFANTADAMWGYLGEHNGRDWTWAGKWAARVDDALSWVPARLTALILILVSGGRGWQRVRQYAASTPSPNSGWPMSALAVSRSISLSKAGVYNLNPQGHLPTAPDTWSSLELCARVVGALAISSLFAVFVSMRFTW